ncbi:MAG: acetoin dehydrogenase dihydrolipoyllysine-residue acetyltransferase subunit [Roseinatronobacter sp.]
MPVEVIMPKVDMDMASGKIALWHKPVGARVTKGEALFDIETDKAAMEVEAPADGILGALQVAEGEQVPIGSVVAYLFAEGEEIAPVQAAVTPRADPAPEPPAEVAQAPAPAEPGSGMHAGTNAGATLAEAGVNGLRATPAARARARAAGVALGSVAGSGPRGRIQSADIAARAMAAAPGGIAAAPGDLHVAMRGHASGALPLVFLHGFAADGTSWAGLEAALPGNPQRYRIDLPNHGRSPLGGAMGFADLVARVRQAFDALDLDGAHLVGHSLGGAVALALADTRARKVGRLTLICPAGLGPQAEGRILTGLARSRRVESLGPWLRELVADPARISDDYLRLAQAQRSDPARLDAQEAMLGALFPDGTPAFDLRPALARLAMPARLIWGRADRLLPWQHALVAPGSVALHLFEGVGHMPQIETPEAVARLLIAG